jgi:hypothetical protein
MESDTTSDPREGPEGTDQPSVSWRPPDAIAVGGEEVVAALSSRDETVAEWYGGSREVFRMHGNRERFAQAGHSLREVMNAVARLAGLPQPAEGRLGDRFRSMTRTWERERERSSCHDGNTWSGEIDGYARTAFGAVEETIEWDKNNRRVRREVFLEVARTLDGSGRRLPETEEARMWRAWDDTKSYFTAVAHHGRATDDAEFTQQLERLDRFILQLFRRDVYREQRRLDDLIARAEHGA